MVRAMALTSQMGLTTSGGTGWGVRLFGLEVGRGIWGFCIDFSIRGIERVSRLSAEEALTLEEESLFWRSGSGCAGWRKRRRWDRLLKLRWRASQFVWPM